MRGWLSLFGVFFSDVLVDPAWSVQLGVCGGRSGGKGGVPGGHGGGSGGGGGKGGGESHSARHMVTVGQLLYAASLFDRGSTQLAKQQGPMFEGPY